MEFVLKAIPVIEYMERHVDISFVEDVGQVLSYLVGVRWDLLSCVINLPYFYNLLLQVL